MVKKISKWVVVIPIKIVEWAIWPIAKVHELLKRLAIWLNKKLSQKDNTDDQKSNSKAG